MEARPEQARRYALTGLERALDGVDRTTALHICFGYPSFVPRAPSALRVPGRARRRAGRPDLDRDRTGQPRRLRARRARRQDDHPRGARLDTPDVETPETVAERIRRALPYKSAARVGGRAGLRHEVPAARCGLRASCRRSWPARGSSATRSPPARRIALDTDNVDCANLAPGPAPKPRRRGRGHLSKRAAPPKRRRGTRGARRRADGRRLRIQRRLQLVVDLDGQQGRRQRQQAGADRVPVLRGGQQLRRPDARRGADGGQGQQLDDQGLRRQQRPQEAVRAAADGDELGRLRRDHRPADLRHRPHHRRPGRHLGRQEGRQHGPDPRQGHVDRPAAGRWALGQRRLRPDRDRDQARQARHPGLPGAEPRSLQGRLPLRHQGLGARRRDQEVLRRGHRRQPGEDRRPGRELLHARPSA